MPVFLFRRDGIIPEEDFGQNADYGKPVQAPNIRFHATVLDQNCRSSLKPPLTGHISYPVHLPPQFPRALERDHPSGSEHHRIPGRRIPAPPLLFIVNTEFTEPADKDVIPGCQDRFDGFDELLDHFGALFLGKSELLVYDSNDVCLGQGHYRYPLRVRWLEFVEFV